MHLYEKEPIQRVSTALTVHLSHILKYKVIMQGTDRMFQFKFISDVHSLLK